ncbi:hypothetical protein DPMN_185233 [Dreissena polymorpha]|uniref:Uncharacterized protein n=1 Tax=Dreissena polymorpha TaxID=45954 RepID=A0A9D4I8J5_DREPO|nr:hypothetical protein DPMN_185233 [Dreissena polymorpha]
MNTNILLTLALAICFHAGYCAAVECYVCAFPKCEDPTSFNKRDHALSADCAQCKIIIGQGCKYNFLSISNHSNNCINYRKLTQQQK